MGILGKKKYELRHLFSDRLLAALDIARALKYLHEKNVIFRDLKPEVSFIVLRKYAIMFKAAVFSFFYVPSIKFVNNSCLLCSSPLHLHEQNIGFDVRFIVLRKYAIMFKAAVFSFFYVPSIKFVNNSCLLCSSPLHLHEQVRGDAKIFDFGLAKELLPRDRVGPGEYKASGLTGSRRCKCLVVCLVGLSVM